MTKRQLLQAAALLQLGRFCSSVVGAGINLVTNLQHHVGISWILQHGQASKNQLCSAVAALLSKRKTLKFCRLYSSRNL